MKRSIAILATALTTTIAAAPAHATFFHTHYCDCGHPAGAAMCGSTSSTSTSSTSGGSTTSSSTTSGGSTTSSSTSGGTTTTSSTTSGGSTTSSSTGGTAVPEPGMLGLMGAGIAGLAFVRRRRR